MKTTARRGLVVAGAAAAAAALWLMPVDAQQPAPTNAGHPDFSGYWELRFDSMNIPKPVLTTQATGESDAHVRKDTDAIRACNNVGVPALMMDRSPLDIRHSVTTIGIVARSPSSVRYIYLDGRNHPDKDELEETTNGHSVGRWQGDSLIVDTTGFNGRGITAIPGGGFRTPKSHLVERFSYVDADRLSATFTWDDPGVFQRPHTYALLYYRVRELPEPRLFNCIPNDPARTKFLTEVPPPAK